MHETLSGTVRRVIEFTCNVGTKGEHAVAPKRSDHDDHLSLDRGGCGNQQPRDIGLVVPAQAVNGR